MCFYWIVGHSFYFIKRMWHCCLWLFDGLLCTMLCLVTQSSLTLCGAMDCSQPGFSLHGDSPGKNTGVGCHALLKGIFPIQGSNPGLLHCRQILYHLSHQGSPRILEWVAYPLSRGSSWHRNQTRLSCTADGFFSSWATREDWAIIHRLIFATEKNYRSNVPR